METADLILDKACIEDWKDMYENVWSREESSRYMFWKVTTSKEDGKARMERTIEFQKSHDTYLVYEKNSHKAIGFAGLQKVKEGVCEETGICLGPDYVSRGYGKQILKALIDRAKQVYHANYFYYCCRKENLASINLALSCGFILKETYERYDERDDTSYTMLRYRKQI